MTNIYLIYVKNTLNTENDTDSIKIKDMVQRCILMVFINMVLLNIIERVLVFVKNILKIQF